MSVQGNAFIINKEDDIYIIPEPRFVCVGESGISHYSTNGLTWTAMSGLDTSGYYRGVTYGNGRFVCVGDSGKSYYSTRGTSWTAMSGLPTIHIYMGVIHTEWKNY